jgi:membrane-bound lytic murein transglycosylase B
VRNDSVRNDAPSAPSSRRGVKEGGFRADLRGVGWATRRLIRAAVPAVLAASVFALLPGGTAAAESPEQAQAAADAAARAVDQLRPQLQSALRAYEASLGNLATDVSAGLTADQQAQDAADAAAAAQRTQTNRVRALYMSGGSVAVLASLLEATSPTDLLSRLDAVSRVVSSDAVAARRADQVALTVRAEADRQLAKAERTTVTASDVEAAAVRLQDLLAAAEAKLQALSARAKGLLEAQQAAQALAAAQAEAERAGLAAAATATARGIPADYLALYRGAATTCPGLDWHVLAAIGQVESGHGRNVGPSSAGAEGPMQFMPSTFAAYAVDGNKDGVTDIWNPADAVYSAANYLCANGAGRPTGLSGAIFRYNHADWYVQMVLRIAAQLTATYPG